MSEQKNEEPKSNIYFSVIIPFRNEAENLPYLLDVLSKQSYQHFQLILIDDHSEDDSFLIAKSFTDQFLDFVLLKAENHGKKQALKQAVCFAKGDLIVCTDADCRPAINWLKSIACFQAKEPCDLILAPVKMTYTQSMFSRLQALEFMSLIASTAGSVGAKMPVLANAANMAFSPKLWSLCSENLQENEASGDDMFLLHQAKKNALTIRFLKSKEAIVETNPCKKLSEFFNQRKRWAGKAKSYRDWQTILVGLVVLALNLSLLTATVMLFFFPFIWKAVVLFWLLKMLVDTAILYRSALFFDTVSLLKYIPLLSFLYPFYAIYSLLGGLWGNISWKGRSI